MRSSWELANRLAALVLLALLGPILVPFALAIRLHGPGPVIFRQPREGLGQRRFMMFKLRTMAADAEARLARRLHDDPAIVAEWTRFGCLRDDPRIAGLGGRLARQLSVDEIPQLWNVVLGEMALVGPRPLPVRLAKALPLAQRARRASVPPGLTGLWQVRGRSELSLRQMQFYDRLYVAKRSPCLDLWILARTPAAVLSRRGAR